MAHTLLLADDSVTIQRVIELTFADEDVRVVAVSDGDEAIAVLDKTPPDIVLADVGMPGRNGYEVAEHMKNTPRLAHIPIMLLTGAFEPIDQAKAKAAGCDGVLAKPFEPQLVIGRVKELLSKPKQVAASIGAPLAAAPAPAKPQVAAVVAPPPPAPKAKSADGVDYFDRLDQAFANLAAPPDNESRSIADAIDSFAKSHPPDKPASTIPPFAERWEPPSPSPAPDLPLASPPPPPISRPAPAVVNRPPSSDAAAQGRPFDAAQGRPAPLPVPPPTFPLADAFAALLAAEQAAPSPSAAPLWPAAPARAAAVSDDLIEQVTRRVLERLSDRVMRDAVAEKISAVAERLVREEIDRIKKSIK